MLPLDLDLSEAFGSYVLGASYLGSARQSSPVAVAKSKEPNLVLLPGAKVSTPTDADELAIGVKKRRLARLRPPTYCRGFENRGTIDLSSVGGASADSLRMVNHEDPS